MMVRKPGAHPNKRLAFGAILAFCSLTMLILVIRNRPYTVSQGAEDLLRTVVEGRPVPGKVVIVNGAFGPLSDAQKSRLIKEVLSPAFTGFQIRDLKRQYASEDSAGVLAIVDGPKGARQMLLVGQPSPDGPALTLDTLLRKAWRIPAGMDDGKTVDWSQSSSALLAGLRRDRTKLEGIGLRGVDFGRQGAMTWDELDAWLSRPGYF